VSDARPITNVTDFVCGTCWSSFSRNDPGVEQAGRLICPHCGHALAADLIADPLAAVRNAPANHDGDGFADLADAPLLHDELPIGDSKPLGWLPHENVARSAEPAGFVVGDPDDDFEDFDFNEATMRPDVSHDGLLAAVRATAEVPDTVKAAPKLDMSGISAGHVVGDAGEEEMASDTVEPTPADFPEGEGEPEDAETRDWKLKAIGLTYNFHGLDALIGWASNKAGQAMQISMDGKNWKDFDSFFTAYRAGVVAAKAYDDALPPGAVQGAAAAASAQAGARMSSGKLATELGSGGKADGNRGPRLTGQQPKPDATALGGKGGASGAKNLSQASSGSRRMPVAAAHGGKTASSNTAKIAAVVVAVLVVAALVAWKLLAKK
jgi:DNA-directed RNA polymerase subunit RPC12/RpoP